ncbi:MAG TPA: PEP-CTERM sorting domain-containing protein [Candidatus Acidoferrales bacterium]|nr:PEP-CTERM sorting domain-containing protein [Candidatus Acidoferrales bacterium]
MRNTCSRLVVALAALTLAAAVNAGTIANSSIAILDSSTPAYGGYPTTDAIDIGFGSQFTDYASNGGGVGTHLDMKFDGPQTFDAITYTDRVTSGAGNGGFHGGTTDFVTSFEYIFATDPNFNNVVGTVFVTASAPVNPSGPSDFQTTSIIPNYTAQYVQWQVLTAGPSGNPGASNFEFSGSAAPEPATLGLLGSALIGLGLLRRKRASGRV